MPTPKTITIDASSAASGVDLDTYFATYFQGLKTGTSSFYGGVEDPAPYGYQNGAQVGFRYADASNAATNKQILIEGEDLAYDFAHHGADKGHGISGTIESVTFGTLVTAVPAGPNELTGVTADLVISGWDLTAAPGSGNVAANPVYNLYNALRKAGTDPAHISTVNTILDEYAQNIIGSDFADTIVGTVNDDTIDGKGGDDFLAGGGGNDVIDGGEGTDTVYFDGIFGQGGTYSFEGGAGGAIIMTDSRTDGTGIDTLKNFEILKFKNLTYNFVTHKANYTPTDVALDDSTVEGDSEFGTVVGTLAVTDQDTSDTHTFSLVNDADGRFFLDGNSIKVAGTLTEEEYTVRVRVVDGAGNAFEKDLTIDVTDPVVPAGAITIDASGADGMDFETFVRGGFISDVEDVLPWWDHKAPNPGIPSTMEGAEMLFSYGEDAVDKYILAHSFAEGGTKYAFGTHVVGGTINTIEYGTRGSGTYDSNGYFIGGDAQLTITGLDLVNGFPPPGATQEEIVAFRAASAVHSFAYAAISGKNAALANLNKYADSLDDYAQNFIGSSGIDRYTGTKFADTISGGAGNDIFTATQGNDTIDGGADNDRAIFSGSKSDYKVTRLLDGSYTIALKNGKGTTTLKGVETATFSDATLDTVSGVLLPGTPPKDLSLSVNSVLEDASVGATVGTFSATDAEGNALDFSLVSDAGGLFEISGTALKVKGKLDYETDKTHKIRLKVTDSDGHIVFKDFLIDVGNVDEGPGNISIAKSVISETSEVGTRVGMLSAVDPEGGAVSYSLTGNPGGYFALTADGKLTLAKEVDYEKKQSHTITVQATDSTGKSTTQAIKIDVGDVTESKAGTDRNDTLTGNIGRDKLSGGAGVDKLLGDGGNDYLYGGSGNDKLTGGAGADDLWGGSGADTFIFKSIKETTVFGAGRDTIFDFSTKQKDKIDLSAIDANTTKGGNQAFSFIGTKAFGGKAGELRYEKAKSDTYIHGDVNGDKVADFTIHLDDRVSLSKSYFIL